LKAVTKGDRLSGLLIYLRAYFPGDAS